MPRRTAGHLSFLIALALLAAPAWASESRTRPSAPLEVTSVLTRFWTALVQHLPFVVSDAADVVLDRGADLDPWG
jgi:hypothetical protein